MRNWRVHLIAASMMAAATTSAFGQQNTANIRDRDPSIAAARELASELRSSTFHRGSFYLLSRLQLSDVGVEEDFYAPTGDQTSGFTLGVQAPQTLYYVPSKKFILSAKFVPGSSFFRRNGSHVQNSYLARGDAHFLFNHLYLNVYTSQGNQLRSNSGELNSLLTISEKQSGVNSELKYSSRTSLTFAGYLRQARYPFSGVQPPDFDVSLLDRSERAGRVSIIHKTFPLTSLSLVGDVRDYSFRTPTKSSQRAFVGSGLSFDSGRTGIRLETGYGQLKFKAPGHQTFRGMLGSLGAQRHLLSRWEGTALVARDLDFSLYENNDYYITDRAALGAFYSATRRLTLTLASDLGRDSYEIPFNGILRKDNFSFTRIGWLYSLRRVQGGFDVGYYRRTSNIDLPSHNGIRTVLHLSFTP